uniref:C2H2-type domain-containing protein n=1 Tax=Oryza punctata TaxID=4537 RepID=A0A0E0KR27_ORYPU
MEFGMVEDAAAEEGLTLSLSLQPSPPRFQALFSCCYCPRKFRSSQALGGMRGRAHHHHHRLMQGYSGDSSAGAAAGRGNGELADEMIDLSLKL